MSPSARVRPRKKIPKRLAIIHADNCTGCEACIEVCPVDCIELRQINGGVKGVQAWREVDLERCIGCEVCIHVPRRRDEPLRLLVCPWEAIEMIPTERVAEAVTRIGGPPEYASEHQPQRAEAAYHVARAFSEQRQ